MSYSQLVMSETPFGYWSLSETQLIDSYSDIYEDVYGGGTNSSPDFTGRNPAIISSAILSLKPIIYGLDGSVALDNDADITINNIYKFFISGAEDKECSIEFFFNINDSLESEINLLSIGSFLNCYVKSDRIYIEANNSVSSILTETWDQTNYVCILYKRGSVSVKLNNKSVASIILPESYKFPDTNPPGLVFGPAASNDIPIYLNAIAIYSYVLSESQMNNRILWSRYGGNADRIATSFNANVINPKHSNELESYSTFISTKENFENGQSRNILISENSITLNKFSPVSVSSKESLVSYNLNINGISFGGASFIDLSDAIGVFNGQESVVRLSVLVDGQPSEQTIFEMGPGNDFLTLSLVKTLNNKFAIKTTDISGTETILIESPDIGSDYSNYFNLAVTMFFGELKLIVNDVLIDTVDISSVSSNFEWYLGNSFSGDMPLTSRVKDFTIDIYDNESNDFIYSQVGLYTLKFLNNFNVSQYGTWSFIYPRIENSISTQVSYNYGTKNSYLFIGDSQIFETQHIPDYNYSNPSNVEITAMLKTEDSANDLPIFDDLSIVSYESLDILSEGSKYLLTTMENDGTEYAVTQGYLLSDRNLSVLDRPKNLGIKFIRIKGYLPDTEDNPDEGLPLNPDINVSTGARISKVSDQSDDNIEMIELVFYASDKPSSDQTYTILDATEAQNLQVNLTSSGIIKNGTFNLYIDGNLTNSLNDVISNEFYYIVVEFNSAVSSDVYLGINKLKSNLLNGTIGNIIIHNNKPSNVQEYVDYRFKAMTSRNKISISDSDSVSISDNYSGSRTYLISEDGRLFSMNELPKIKIVQDRWENFV